MRNLLNSFIVTAALFAVTILSGCENQPEIEPAGPATVIITQGSVSETSIAVEFTPNANTVKFEFAIGETADLDAFNDGTLAGIVKVDGGGKGSHTFSDLDAGTEYTVFAAATNADGVKGETVIKNISTAESVNPSAIAIEIETVTAESVIVRFTPNDTTVEYLVAITDDESKVSGMEDGEFNGAIRIENGNAASHMFEGLMFDEEYIVMAVGKNADGQWGEVARQTVSTNSSQGAAAKIVMNYRDTTPHSVVASIAVSAGTARYRYAFVTTDIEEARAAFIAGTLESTVEVSGTAASGISADMLTPCTDYPVLVECFGEGNTSTGVKTLYVRTADGPAVHVRVTSRNAFYVYYDVEMNDFCEYAYNFITPQPNWPGGDNYETGSFYADFYINTVMVGMMERLKITQDQTDAMAATMGNTNPMVFVTLAYDIAGKSIYQLHHVEEYMTDPSLPLPSPMTAIKNNVTSVAVQYKLTMNANTEAFYVTTIMASVYDGDSENIGVSSLSVDEQNQFMIDNGDFGYLPEETYTKGGLTPSTDYVMLLAPMNGNGRQGFGGPPAVYRFTTLAQ